jgi:hypothetical protein
MPSQPWDDIRGMGNRLRHAYDRPDMDIIWKTAQARLPELAAEEKRALGRLHAGQGDTPHDPSSRDRRRVCSSSGRWSDRRRDRNPGTNRRLCGPRPNNSRVTRGRLVGVSDSLLCGEKDGIDSSPDASRSITLSQCRSPNRGAV